LWANRFRSHSRIARGFGPGKGIEAFQTMLRYLKVSHLAIIEEVQVEFQDGLNILTGETGAGKSILIGALNLLLGARVSSDIIRTGEDEAAVEALFEVPDTALLPEDLDRGGELILTRRVFRSGRSRCYINGNLATLAVLGSVGRSLISIFGQNEHQVLTDPDEHVEILDRFGGLSALRDKAAETFSEWKRSARDLSAAQKELDELKAQEDETAAAAEELAEADLKENQEEELVSERELLRKAVEIREQAYEAYQNLYSGSGSIMESFSDVRKAVEYLASVNPALTKMRENLEEAIYRAEDVAMELRDVAEKSQSDPLRLERIEERLALIRRLKKKYGMDLDGLIAHQETLNREAGDLLDAGSKMRKLESSVALCRDAYLAAARGLSKARKGAARKLEASMKEELKDLAMSEAIFTVNIEELDEEKAGPAGLEKVEFFLASNPGEASRPLARIASGGELSRIMLAVKALQVYRESASTVIFDEVDAGIGGHTAFAVGTRLARVAEGQQLLCVTHLHQIAALAEHHLSVRKSVKKGRTQIQVKTLDHADRVEELARMLGAAPDSESAREHVLRLMNEGRVEVSG